MASSKNSTREQLYSIIIKNKSIELSLGLKAIKTKMEVSQPSIKIKTMDNINF